VGGARQTFFIRTSQTRLTFLLYLPCEQQQQHALTLQGKWNRGCSHGSHVSEHGVHKAVLLHVSFRNNPTKTASSYLASKTEEKKQPDENPFPSRVLLPPFCPHLRLLSYNFALTTCSLITFLPPSLRRTTRGSAIPLVPFERTPSKSPCGGGFGGVQFTSATSKIIFGNPPTSERKTLILGMYLSPSCRLCCARKKPAAMPLGDPITCVSLTAVARGGPHHSQMREQCKYKLTHLAAQDTPH
jgi:hypothetical protein